MRGRRAQHVRDAERQPLRTALRFLHIAGAILLAGGFATAGVWLAASLRRPDAARVAPFVQELLRLTGRGIGVSATVAVLVTGLWLAFLVGYSWAHAVWLVASLVAFAAAGAVWHWGLIPLRRRMGDIAAEGEKSGALPEDYARLARRWLSVNAAILLLLAVILFLMTAKPTLG